MIKIKHKLTGTVLRTVDAEDARAELARVSAECDEWAKRGTKALAELAEARAKIERLTREPLS